MYDVYACNTQVATEMDVACCDMHKLIALGNSTSTACLALTNITLTDSTVVPNSPGRCIAEGLLANGLAQRPTPMFPTTTPIVYMQNTVRSTSDVGGLLVALLNTPLLGWFCATVITLLYLLERMRVSVLDEYLDRKWVELDQQRLDMEKQIIVRQRRINMNTK
jgi:hypothetical protein